MFEHPVFIVSCSENVKLLKRMNLIAGRDFRSERGSVAAGRPDSLKLMFRDRTHAIMFKLRAQ